MEWVYLLLATFFASIVQAATGFGFALIAVPLFLIVINSADAIQLVIIITLVTSSIHWLNLRHITPVFILKWLIVGCIIGLPLGIFVFTQLELDVLKKLIAVVIILISLQNGWFLFREGQTQTSADTLNSKPLTLTGVGFISGLMGTSMAMPGPPLMLYLSRTTLGKDQIRAAMFAFFVCSYSGALITQSLFIGVDGETWTTGGILIPIAVLGAMVGHWLSDKISENYFKLVVLLILLLTGSLMLLNT